MTDKKKNQTIEEVIYEVLLELFKLECSNVFRYPVDTIKA